ncbi:hypothetical protein [Pseudomonas sp. LFS044]|uniref:hypothetical protein n=1 Tax=Pseudomonas sp. LFS044 TaxID=3229880 RepID=UPI003A800D78
MKISLAKLFAGSWGSSVVLAAKAAVPALAEVYSILRFYQFSPLISDIAHRFAYGMPLKIAGDSTTRSHYLFSALRLPQGWMVELSDQSALIADPDGRGTVLSLLAVSAYRRGEVDADQLPVMLELLRLRDCGL